MWPGPIRIIKLVKPRCQSMTERWDAIEVPCFDLPPCSADIILIGTAEIVSGKLLNGPWLPIGHTAAAGMPPINRHFSRIDPRHFASISRRREHGMKPPWFSIVMHANRETFLD